MSAVQHLWVALLVVLLLGCVVRTEQRGMSGVDLPLGEQAPEMTEHSAAPPSAPSLFVRNETEAFVQHDHFAPETRAQEDSQPHALDTAEEDRAEELTTGLEEDEPVPLDLAAEEDVERSARASGTNGDEDSGLAENLGGPGSLDLLFGAIFVVVFLRYILNMPSIPELWRRHKELDQINAYFAANITNDMKNRIDFAILLTIVLLIAEITDRLFNVLPINPLFSLLFSLTLSVVSLWILWIVARTALEQFSRWNRTAKNNGDGISRRVIYFVTQYRQRKLKYLVGYFERVGVDLTMVVLTPAFALGFAGLQFFLGV